MGYCAHWVITRDDGAVGGSPVRLSRPARAQALFLAVFTVVAVLYFAVPYRQSMLVWGLAAGLAIAGVARGVRINEPASRWPWRLLLCALGFNFAGILLSSSVVFAPAMASSLYPVGTFTRMAGFPCAAVALGLLTRLRSGRTAAAGWLDTAIITCGLAMLTWSFLVLPGYRGASYGIAVPWTFTVALPAADAVLCALAARFIAAGALRWRSARLLILGTVGQLGSDVYFATAADHSNMNASRLGCIGFLCCYAAWALAALDPDMVRLGRVHGFGMQLRWWSVVLAAAAVSGPLALLVQERRHASHYLIVLTLCSAVLVLVVVIRLSLAMLERLSLDEQVRRQEKEAYFKVLVSNSVDVIMIVEADGTVRYAGPSALEMFYGRDPAGHGLEDLLGRRQAERLSAAMHRTPARAGGRPGAWPLSLRLRSPDGSEADVEARCDDLREEPAVAGFVLTLRDVTEQRMLERELRHQAFHDSLTGLANRRRLAQLLDQAVAAVEAGAVLGVVVVDMDDFKTVNDRYGHAVGDEVIAGIAARLTENLRRGDVAARLGGDEFALILGPAGDVAELEQAAHRIKELFDRPFSVSVGELGSTASVGLATTADDARLHETEALSGDELLRRADIAHYAVKQSGKQGARRYHPALDATYLAHHSADNHPTDTTR